MNHAHALLWTITFGLFIASAVMVVRRPAWGRPLLAFVAAGAAFQVLTLVQPPVLVGTLLVAATAALIVLPGATPEVK